MRSSLPSSNGEETDPKEEEEEDPFAPFYWWRPIEEFDPKTSELNPKVRVLRELERLALASHESFDELRHRLVTYKPGDLWFPAGGLERKDTDIPPVITIFLVGFQGCGKSSVVNMMYSVLGRSGILPFAQSFTPAAGKDGRTQVLEEHNVLRSMRNGFCIFDSRGLEYDRLNDGLEEVSEWMEGGVHHCQLCRSSGMMEASPSTSKAAVRRFVWRRVNCVMVVVSVSEVHLSLMGGDFRILQATKELFHSPSIHSHCNEVPILLLTRGDELSAEDRINARVRLCEFLGISDTIGVYDIACPSEHGLMVVEEMDPVTAYALLESIYRALLVADRCHPPKRGLKDWFALGLTWTMWALSSFFRFLADFCSSLAKRAQAQIAVISSVDECIYLGTSVALIL